MRPKRRTIRFRNPIPAIEVDGLPFVPKERQLVACTELPRGNWALIAEDSREFSLMHNLYRPNPAVQLELIELHEQYQELTNRWKYLRSTLTPISIGPPEEE